MACGLCTQHAMLSEAASCECFRTCSSTWCRALLYFTKQLNSFDNLYGLVLSALRAILAYIPLRGLCSRAFFWFCTAVRSLLTSRRSFPTSYRSFLESLLPSSFSFVNVCLNGSVVSCVWCWQCEDTLTGCTVAMTRVERSLGELNGAAEVIAAGPRQKKPKTRLSRLRAEPSRTKSHTHSSEAT